MKKIAEIVNEKIVELLILNFSIKEYKDYPEEMLEKLDELIEQMNKRSIS